MAKTMSAWRIAAKMPRHIADGFSCGGAESGAGRWNSVGLPAGMHQRTSHRHKSRLSLRRAAEACRLIVIWYLSKSRTTFGVSEFRSCRHQMGGMVILDGAGSGLF